MAVKMEVKNGTIWTNDLTQVWGQQDWLPLNNKSSMFRMLR